MRRAVGVSGLRAVRSKRARAAVASGHAFVQHYIWSPEHGSVFCLYTTERRPRRVAPWSLGRRRAAISSPGLLCSAQARVSWAVLALRPFPGGGQELGWGRHRWRWCVPVARALGSAHSPTVRSASGAVCAFSCGSAVWSSRHGSSRRLSPPRPAWKRLLNLSHWAQGA